MNYIKNIGGILLQKINLNNFTQMGNNIFVRFIPKSYKLYSSLFYTNETKQLNIFRSYKN